MAGAFETSPQEAAGLSLQDGSRVAIVGGGPAGSFFAYFVLKFAAEIGLDVQVDIYEPRSFARCGPAGCNHCGGIVSESMVQILAADGIRLPPSVVQRGIDSYQIHMDVGSVGIAGLAGESRIAALFRGNGPREGGDSDWESFDGYLQSLACQQGARVVRRLVTGVEWHEGFPALKFADRSQSAYDLVTIASGVNSNLLGGLESLPARFEPPRTTRTYICEFKAGREGVRRLLGNAVHVFLLDIPRLEFAAIIPKGEFATVTMVGENLDQALVHAFLRDPVVRAAFPTGEVPCVCSCSPLINMGPRRRPYADRLVMVGDSGITRLYKDGIGAAYRTAKAAASTAVLHGISEADFRAHFWPTCQTISRDNAIGKMLFSTTALMKRFRFMRRIIHRMLAREQSVPQAVPHMSTLMWNMFTGSAPYAEMLRGTARPGFLGNFLLNTLYGVRPARRPGGEV
jgi:flavin-dependent dehydrogenase